VLPGAVLPGTVLYDEVWLAGRVADTGRRWNCEQPRINAMLWWYSASGVLLRPTADGLLSGQPADPDPAHLKLWLRADGYLDGVAGERVVPPGQLGARLRRTLRPVTDALAAAGEANPRALWAITADSLAVGATRAGVGRAVIAEICADAGMPAPRYLPTGSVRRCSCCLLYRVDGEDKCRACPRRPLAERR
jgi:hypothetical protein